MEQCKRCNRRTEGTACPIDGCPQIEGRLEKVETIARSAMERGGGDFTKIVADFNFLNLVENTVGRVLTEQECERALNIKREMTPAT